MGNSSKLPVNPVQFVVRHSGDEFALRNSQRPDGEGDDGGGEDFVMDEEALRAAFGDDFEIEYHHDEEAPPEFDVRAIVSIVWLILWVVLHAHAARNLLYPACKRAG
jgi:hypothetical protein